MPFVSMHQSLLWAEPSNMAFTRSGVRSPQLHQTRQQLSEMTDRPAGRFVHGPIARDLAKSVACEPGSIASGGLVALSFHTESCIIPRCGQADSLGGVLAYRFACLSRGCPTYRGFRASESPTGASANGLEANVERG